MYLSGNTIQPTTMGTLKENGLVGVPHKRSSKRKTVTCEILSGGQTGLGVTGNIR